MWVDEVNSPACRRKCVPQIVDGIAEGCGRLFERVDGWVEGTGFFLRRSETGGVGLRDLGFLDRECSGGGDFFLLLISLGWVAKSGLLLLKESLLDKVKDLSGVKKRLLASNCTYVLPIEWL